MFDLQPNDLYEAVYIMVAELGMNRWTLHDLWPNDPRQGRLLARIGAKSERDKILAP